MRYQSTKVIDGLSTCFRQWRAKSHCSKLHGYALNFKITFETDSLDSNNWVVDFGFLKSGLVHNKYTFKEWFAYMFDHTTIIADDDPEREVFTALNESKIIDLRFSEKVGCEAFANLVYNYINNNLDEISQNPQLKVKSVECIENEKNSAIYYGE